MDTLALEASADTICVERIGAVLESRLGYRLRALSRQSGQPYDHLLGDAVSLGWEHMQEWDPAASSFEQRLVFWCRLWIVDQTRKCYRAKQREKLVRPDKLEALGIVPGHCLRPVHEPVQDMVRRVGAVEEWQLLLTTLGDLSELQRAALLAPGTGDTDRELATRFQRAISTVRSARHNAHLHLASIGFRFEV